MTKSEQHQCSDNVTDWSSRWTVKIKRMTKKHAAYTARGANPPLSTPRDPFWGAATEEHPQTVTNPDGQREDTQVVQQVGADGRTPAHLHHHTTGCVTVEALQGTWPADWGPLEEAKRNVNFVQEKKANSLNFILISIQTWWRITCRRSPWWRPPRPLSPRGAQTTAEEVRSLTRSNRCPWRLQISNLPSSQKKEADGGFGSSSYINYKFVFEFLRKRFCDSELWNILLNHYLICGGKAERS